MSDSSEESSMTKEEIQELIHATVIEAIKDLDLEKVTHETKRATVTKFKDKSGTEYISTTLKAGELIKRGLIVVGAIVGSIVACVTWANQWFIVPQVKEVAAQEASIVMARHEENVKMKMEGIKDQYLPRSEFDIWAAEKDQRWKQQDEMNQDFKALVDEMRKDIKELLRRVK
jgi:hypothetical protein